MEEGSAQGDFLAELARQAIAGAAVDDLGVLLVRQQRDVWVTDGKEEDGQRREEWPIVVPITGAMQLPLFGRVE